MNLCFPTVYLLGTRFVSDLYATASFVRLRKCLFANYNASNSRWLGAWRGEVKEEPAGRGTRTAPSAIPS
jgi:hypothetical protein